MRALCTAAVVLLFAGCVTTTTTTTAQAPAGAPQTFSGEVWTWDEPNNTVTLFKEGKITRVRTTPEQMRTLRLHEQARITGELAPPADLLVVTNTGPVTFVPRGQAESMEVKGTVASVDPQGRLAVTSDRGPIHVWGAAGADQRFAKGAPVSVKMSVQPVDARPVAAGQPAPATNAGAASPSSEPGDHAVVTGRIIGVNPGGVLVVESPTGPIQVLVADGGKYKVGDWVEVHSTVSTTS
jgi:hypothetical protein